MFQSFDAITDRSFAGKHLPLLRAKLAERNLQGLLVPHEDEYLNEYLPDYAERLAWLTGFSGSAGSAIVLTERAAAFSDGRYAIQLPQQVDDAHFELHMTHDVKPDAWLQDNASAGDRIGYDPLLFSVSALRSFERAAQKVGFSLVPVQPNPIDEVWADQPAPPSAPVVPHPLDYAGEAHGDKLARIGKDIADAGADLAIITSPSSLAWLFNVRGGDVHAAPLPLGRALVGTDGKAEVFLHPDKVSQELRDHLGDDVVVRDEAEVEAQLKACGEARKRVLVDFDISPVHYLNIVQSAGGDLVKGSDPVALPRAIKNDVEREGTRQAHIRDGAAVTRFLRWLSIEGPKGTVTEIDAAIRLEEFRRDTNVLQDISFDSITGSGAHGAMAHYRVTRESNREMKPGELFLIDSGGQYKDGTTDITRVIAIGEPSEEMRQRYTAVLKGHISLAVARFPKGTSGHALDALARLPMWQMGLDYDHGTGHGVGSFLSVHEGPQRISKAPNEVGLEPGMILSNEPGYYKEGAYGIRIENLILVTEATEISGGERPMMAFENLTWAPLERELIDPAMLSSDEAAWVDDYHESVLRHLESLLPADDAAWLKERCAPLS